MNVTAFPMPLRNYIAVQGLAAPHIKQGRIVEVGRHQLCAGLKAGARIWRECACKPSANVAQATWRWLC